MLRNYEASSTIKLCNYLYDILSLHLAENFYITRLLLYLLKFLIQFLLIFKEDAESLLLVMTGKNLMHFLIFYRIFLRIAIDIECSKHEACWQYANDDDLTLIVELKLEVALKFVLAYAK